MEPGVGDAPADDGQEEMKAERVSSGDRVVSVREQAVPRGAVIFR